jgi:hypothetical protein
MQHYMIKLVSDLRQIQHYVINIGVAWVFFLVRQKMLAGSGSMLPLQFLKRWALETHFPEFKWIIYDFNNNRNNTQKTISICV